RHIGTEQLNRYPYRGHRPDDRSKKIDSGYSDGSQSKSGTRQSASTESKTSEEIMTRNKRMGNYMSWENKPFLQSK
ncbi:Hypothetical predicted protein, partial [Mytilus galloprovincialis]